MRKVLLWMVLLLSLSAHSQINKIEVEKPLREVYISTPETKVERYEEFIKVRTLNQNYSKIRDSFSFTLSLEDYKSLGALVEEGREGDIYHLVGYEGEDISIFFTTVLMKSKPAMVLSVKGKTMVYSVFSVNHYKKKFFSLVD